MIEPSPNYTFRIFSWLRVTSIVAQLVVISGAGLVLGDGFRALPLFAVTAFYAVWHAGLLLRMHIGHQGFEWRLAMELSVDLVVITILLCLAGGWSNPFASVYLVPLGFAAAVLTLRGAVFMTGLAIACYLVTALFYVPLPHVEPLHGDSMSMHLIGMALSFLLASVVLVATVGFVRRAHDGERRALAQEREARLRDEQLLSLGVLAASTAHELGTPLSTARLLVEEIEEMLPEIDEITVLRRQLDYAVDRLHRLVRIADDHAGEDVNLDEFCSGIGDRLRILRPDVALKYTADLPSVPIRYSRPLESALLSLMVNAATASIQAGCEHIQVNAGIEAETLWLCIRDFGEGFRAGFGVEEHRGGGLGVGLVISSATLERFGGNARHQVRNPGTEVLVNIPLRTLAETP